ncbi:MAG: cytochrome c [Nitriliruptoraceae bacterium]
MEPLLERAGKRAMSVVAAVALSLTGCGRGEPTGIDAERARGAELYQLHCVACHGGPEGGEISDIPPRHNAQGHTWHHADCELIDIVRDGLPRRPGQPEMPAFGEQLSDEEIRSILSHLETWWEPDQRAHQEQVTDDLCR